MDPFKMKEFCFYYLFHAVWSYVVEEDDLHCKILEKRCLAIYVGCQQREGSTSNEPAACVDAQ